MRHIPDSYRTRNGRARLSRSHLRRAVLLDVQILLAEMEMSALVDRWVCVRISIHFSFSTVVY